MERMQARTIAELMHLVARLELARATNAEAPVLGTVREPPA